MMIALGMVEEAALGEVQPQMPQSTQIRW